MNKISPFILTEMDAPDHGFEVVRRQICFPPFTGSSSLVQKR